MEHLTLLVHLTDNADEMQFANLLSIYNTKCTLLLSAAYAIVTVAFTKKKSSGIIPSTKMAKGRCVLLAGLLSCAWLCLCMNMKRLASKISFSLLEQLT